MTAHRRGFGSSPDSEPPEPIEPPKTKPIEPKKLNLLIPLFVGGVIVLGGASFLFLKSSSIEMICLQVGNCQRFKEDATTAQTAFSKAEDSFKSARSVPQLLQASKLIDEAKTSLSTIPDNATEIVPPISEQKSKAIELDKKIAVSLALEQNADQTLKEAIAKIANADQLNRNPQGKKEPPEDAKTRLNKPKALYVEAQILLKSIPDNSFVANSKKEKLKQVAEKITDLDGKFSTIVALDPCVVNPDSCKPPADPCVANPAACEVTTPPPGPGPTFCEINPAACESSPPPPGPSGTPLFGPGSPGYNR